MKRMILRSLALVFLLVATACGTFAQEVSEFTFSHIGQADGMHSQRIYTVLQTADGALWWSTKNGVERYNGVSIRHYVLNDQRHQSDLAGRQIELSALQEVSGQQADASQLLAYDNKGYIFSYNPVYDAFRLKTNVSALAKTPMELNHLLPTRQGIWIASKAGIFFLNGDTLTPVVKNVHANYIVKTPSTLLFCTRTGVLEYQCGEAAVPKAGTPLRSVAPYDVESGYYDPLFNKVWLGGYSSGIRVMSYNESGKHITGYELVETNLGDIHNPVRSICPYDDHQMLVGIDGLGVLKVSRHPQATGKYGGSLLFDANQGPHGVLHGNGVYSVIRGIWGNIVVGTYSGGIDIARPVGSTIAIYQHKANDQSILNDRVNCVAQLSDGSLAMGTDNGVSLMNPHTRQWRHACRGTVVIGLCKTSSGLLAATYGKGVYEITQDGASRQLYSKENGILQDDHVYKIVYDRHGDLWIGCLDGDLVQVSGGTPHYYPIHYVKDILQLPDGRMAIATTEGVKMVSPDGKVKTLNYAIAGQEANLYVHTLLLNTPEELWLGTDGGGIYIYNLKTQKSRQLTTQNGLTSDYINSFCKDNQGRILVGSENGLSFIAPQDPDHAVGVNYCHGVNREYTSRAVVTLNNGHLLFGSTTGAVIIDPSHIQKIDYTTKLNILGVSCDVEDSDAFLERVHRMLEEGKLQLSYRQRTFDLFFESINLRNQADIVYQYKVGKGDWSPVTNQQHIRFANMEPGDHLLLLRSISASCGTVLDEVELTINIGAPWWNSWWMWTIYLALVVLAFYGAWRIYELHSKYMRLVLMRSEKLEPQREPLPLAAGKAEHPSSVSPPTEALNEETSQEQASAEEDDMHGESSDFIDKVTRMVVENLSDNQFNIDRLCREMAMSRTLFYIKLKSYTGKSPQDFIRVIRLERAAALLRSGRTVADVAALTGFENSKYFSTVFKKYFKVSPSKYTEKV